MIRPSEKVDRFLRALRLRGWMLRLLESAAVGILIAAAAGLATVAVMYSRHRSAEAAVFALLAAGAAVGAAVGAWRRPTLLRMAAEADRQLHLPELLSSAAMLPVSAAREDMDRALRQMLAGRAAEACAQTSPRQIRLRRFGANGWAAIVLAAGLPVLVGTLVLPPAPTRPTAEDAAMAAAAAESGDAPLVQLADSAAGPRQQMDPDERRPAPPVGDYEPASPSPSIDPAPQTSGHIAPSAPGDRSGNGTGAGNAHTNVQQPPTPSPTPTDLTVMPNSSPTAIGTPAGGVGPPSIGRPGSGSGNTAGGIGHSVDTVRPAPWQSPTWAAEAQSARHQADAGQIPAAYVELVRDYFSRDGT